MGNEKQRNGKPNLVGDAGPLRCREDLFVDGFQDEPDMLNFIDEVRGRHRLPNLQRFQVTEEQVTDPDISVFLDAIRGR